MTEPPPTDRMAGMITGYWTSQAIYVAAKLGIADLLVDGPRTADQLAQDTGTHARSLYRLLRALASVGVFSESEGGALTHSRTLNDPVGPRPDPSLTETPFLVSNHC